MGRRPRTEGLPRPPGGSPGRRSPWPAALLAASILCSGFLLTEALDIDVTVKPSQRLDQGKDATLTPGGTGDFLTCEWYRGEQAETYRILRYVPASNKQVNGPGFTGRETTGPGCSLHIKSLTPNDTGTYIVSKIVMDGTSETGRVPIEVIEKLSPPTLRPEESIVKEHANVTLNCTISASSTVNVTWLKDGQPVPAKAVKSEQDQILLVPDVGKDDEGTYTCVVSNPANSATSNPSKIVVESASPGGLSPGAIVGIVIGCLAGVVLIVAVLYFVCKGTSLGRMVQHSSNGNVPSAPGQNQGVTDTKPKAGEEDIQYTTLAFSSGHPQPDRRPAAPSENNTVYIEIKKK